MAVALWTPAYIGVGSNLDDPRAQVLRGIEALHTLSDSKVIAQSGLYRSAPLGPQDQPHFVNAVAGMLTQLDAAHLLRELKSLEARLGRAQPIERWGPRVIDFDLLVFGSERSDSPELRLPHPGVAERPFVLAPLMDVAPDLEVPGKGRVCTLAAGIDRRGLERL